MSSFWLKIFALIFMIIDHAGFIFFPNTIWFRIIGRLAFPLFAYQMAVGYSHTQNRNAHILKLLLFGILVQIPYTLMLNLYEINFNLNIIFTFVLGLLLINLLENFQKERKAFILEKSHSLLRIFNLVLSLFLGVSLVILGVFLKVDYTWYGILLTAGFYFTLHNKLLTCVFFLVLVTLNIVISQNLMSLLGCLGIFDLFFILAFNGKKGYHKSWPFYLIYLLHFGILLGIHQLFIV